VQAASYIKGTKFDILYDCGIICLTNNKQLTTNNQKTEKKEEIQFFVVSWGL